MGDRVSCCGPHSEPILGTIIQMNPERAVVDTGNEVWNIPYDELDSSESSNLARRNQRLETIGMQADALLAEHGLHDWLFSFSHAKSRAGYCDFDSRTIHLTWQFCLKVDEGEILDTILHEISHALVGAEHGHDSVWREQALKIGCSANVTHCRSFTSPKYIAFCPVCGWRVGKHKRLRNAVCKKCRTAISYALNRPHASAAS